MISNPIFLINLLKHKYGQQNFFENNPFFGVNSSD